MLADPRRIHYEIFSRIQLALKFSGPQRVIVILQILSTVSVVVGFMHRRLSLIVN